MAVGSIPAVAVQEHGTAGAWLGERALSCLRSGWKVLGAAAQITEAGGRSGGVALVVPACVGVRYAPGQSSWDIAPCGCQGRLAMALIDIGKLGWVACFTAYLWTGEGLTSYRNAFILDELVRWIAALKLPWIVAVDWQNEPAQLAESPGTCKLGVRCMLGMVKVAPAGPAVARSGR